MTGTSKPATPETWTADAALSDFQGGSLAKYFCFRFYFRTTNSHAQFLCQEMMIFSSVADKLWGGSTATLVFLQETWQAVIHLLACCTQQHFRLLDMTHFKTLKVNKFTEKKMYVSVIINDLEGMNRHHMHSAQSFDQKHYKLPGDAAVINTEKLAHIIHNSKKRTYSFWKL